MNHAKFAETFFHKKLHSRPSGYPVATIAYYGPDDQTATKVAVGIVDARDEVIELRKWLVRAQDVRIDGAINNEILTFIKEHNAQRVAIVGRILGCPHEEGVDYPEGTKCAQCPYWEKIDRWTGKVDQS
jgi:hypothetical protein